MIDIAHVGSMKSVASFADIQTTIREHLAPWNLNIAGNALHGVSLRLSQMALADPLLTAANLKAIAGEYDLNVVGFSGVGISGGRKEQVHHPDWRSEERLSFMFGAANLAAELAAGQEFGITTSALSYRTWVDSEMPGNWAAITLNLIRVVQHLVQIRERTGLTIHIDLEAEPGSLLRDADDIVRFWEQWLTGRGTAMLSDRMPITDGTALDAVLRHVRLALDTSHAAVVGDDAVSTLDRFATAGVRIGRLQVSSALACDIPDEPSQRVILAEQLQSQVSDSLLQQVVAYHDGEIVHRFADLPDAIASIDENIGTSWRIHTHVPVLADDYGTFASTRNQTANWLREIAVRGTETGLVELRSANWSVVSPSDSAPAMIAQEATWVREIMSPAP